MFSRSGLVRGIGNLIHRINNQVHLILPRLFLQVLSSITPGVVIGIVAMAGIFGMIDVTSAADTVSTTGVGDVTDPCNMELQDKNQGIHIIVSNCSNIGTFSLGALYNGNWEKLTYHYPAAWEGSFLSVKIDDKIYSTSGNPGDAILMDQYIENRPETKPDVVDVVDNDDENGPILMSMSWKLPENIIVEQIFETVGDGTRIHIRLTNENSNSMGFDTGIRLHIDTMLGDNDGAPIYVPGDGLKTTENEYIGHEIDFGYWKAYNKRDNPTLVATGILGPTNPGRMVIVNWKNSMLTAWDYEINKSVSVIGDSAILLYYEGFLKPGETKEVATMYKSGEPIIPQSKSFGIAEIVADKQDYCAGDVAIIKVDVVSTGGDNQGSLDIEITGNHINYSDKKITGVVKADSVNTIKFTWIIPDINTTTTPGMSPAMTPGTIRFNDFDVKARLYTDKLIDEKVGVIPIDKNCIIPEEDTQGEFNLLIPLFILVIMLILFLVFYRAIIYPRRGKMRLTKTRNGDLVTVTVRNNTNEDKEDCVIEDKIAE